MSTKIAIVGHGFVGKAVDYGFNSPDIEKIIIDPILGTSIGDLDGEDLTATFVCLPTPMGKDGHINCQLVTDTVAYLKENTYGLIIVKSTITPDIVGRLTFGTERVVYNPEFLAERTANEDFANPQLHVFGGHPDKTKEVEELYKQYSICKPCQSFHMSAVDASFVKYGINSYLATKVAWFNQYYDMVNNHGGNFYKVLNAVTHDDRVGTSHTAVPGYDGKRGFGGACFPKDTSALLGFDPSLTILREACTINNAMRSMYEKDDREKEQNISFD